MKFLTARTGIGARDAAYPPRFSNGEDGTGAIAGETVFAHPHRFLLKE